MPEDDLDAGVLHVARAEMVLARDDRLPLRAVPAKPDPLTGFARAFAALREDLGESADVAIDLLPLTAAERRHHQRRPAEGGRGGSSLWGPHGVGGGLSLALLGHQHHTPGRTPPTRTSAGRGRPGTDPEVSKIASSEAAFRLQILIKVTSEIPERPAAHLHALIAAFEPWADANYLRVAGLNLFGMVHFGADRWWRRRDFDRRMDSGLFAPKKAGVVTATEIAGLLKPPTAHCAAANVIRSGGVVPLPPRALLTYDRQPDLLPLGVVPDEDNGERAVGVRLADTYFSFMTGRSRYGKTESAIVRFVALARAGHGCLFLDPHADALARMKPYLADLEDRVVEINLAPRGRAARQAGWNLFSMEGRTSEDVESRVSAVVDSFASALQWGEVNNRALTLTTMAAQSLCELALALPAELAPTLFQMTTILADDEWRQAVLPYLSAASRSFWETRFGKLAADAITPVTNIVDRLRSSATIAALFGSSRSTYDVRAAMDAGKVVLACPAGTGDKDRLVANFFIYDLLQAALSRKDLPPQDRRPFHVFVDEMQSVDGAAKGNLAALLEQCGKYGIRLHAMAQQPTRLTKTTLDALLTNRSHLMSTVVGADSAKLLAREWAHKVHPDTVTQLEKYHFIGSVTIAGQATSPFRFRGFEISEVFGDIANPEGVAELDEQIDRNVGRRPVGAMLSELDRLDDAIKAHLTGRSGGPGPQGPPQPNPPSTPPSPSKPNSSSAGSGRGSGRHLHVVGR
jgi:hypothetical protein